MEDQHTHNLDEENLEDATNEEDEIHEKGFLGKLALFFLEVIKIVILAGITIGIVRYFLFKPFYVKGHSMEPSFYEKDYLIIDEISYRFKGPERGEVVVFNSPVNDDYYLKRIIALPGERVKIADNKVVIYNDAYPRGVVLEEVYLEEETQGEVSMTLGDTQYFVLGDNRDASYDSRRFGAVSVDEIVGKVWFRGWPVSRVSGFDVPKYNFISTTTITK
ncbi:MAG: signal peptidase I [Candidatus Magasanikbacteria bacterium]|nr:signal peptidase I [Candidatus Magasanikbacteria bacterium]